LDLRVLKRIHSNERLQHHFNEYIFDDEQTLYKREGIHWDFIQFPDNHDVIDLLANRRTGLFALCDEQVLFPRANDLTLVRKFYENCTSHPRFMAGRVEVGKNMFIVKHFAGPVLYTSAGMLEKNHDIVRTDMAILLKESSIPTVSTLYNFCRVDEDTAAALSGGNTGTGRPPIGMSGKHTHKIFSVSGEFRKQLNELMDNINTTSPYYVRCLKPNSQNRSGFFDDHLVIDQLRCNGVLEAVRVSRAGYPNRIPFDVFGRRYAALVAEERSGIWSSERCLSLCEKLAEIALNSSQFKVSSDSKDQKDAMVKAGFQIGTSLVFLRRGTFDFVEKRILTFQRAAAVKVQATYRRYYAVNKYKASYLAVLLLQRGMRCYLARRRVNMIRQSRARSVLQRTVRGFLVRLKVSKEFPEFSRLHEKISDHKLQVKLLSIRRAVNLVMVAKKCKAFYLRRRAARQFKAASTIQCRVRVFINRFTLVKKRRDVMQEYIIERKRMQAQMLADKMKWEAERDRMVQVNRQQSILLHDQISALKADMQQLKTTADAATEAAKDWEDRAKSAMKINQDRAAGPTCDDTTLRSIITKEMMTELKKANTEIETLKLHLESLETENKTLVSAVSSSPERRRSTSFQLEYPSSEVKTRTSRSYSGVSAPDSLVIADITFDLSELESEYKMQLDEFDRSVEAIKREKLRKEREDDE